MLVINHDQVRSFHKYVLSANYLLLLDIVLDKNSWSSALSIEKNYFHHIQKTDSQPTTFSMMESIQNLFQRMVKPASSTPSTPKLSHEDHLTFRIRPFPMSSCNEESTNSNPFNKRFYHVFKHGELERLIEEASKTIVGSKIIKSFYDHGNWCAIVQKDIEVCSL